VCGRSLDEFGIAPVHGYSSDLLPHAEVFVALAAKLAFSASPIKPRHTDSLSDRDALHGRPHLDHLADNFVSENQWLLHQTRQLLPVSVGNMEIRVANAANLNLDQDFLLRRLGKRHVRHHKRSLEVMEHRCFHWFPRENYTRKRSVDSISLIRSA
jgi:hypothetical protein